MVDFAIFRMHDTDGDFDSFVEFQEDDEVEETDAVEGPDFSAKLYVANPYRRRPSWVPFLQSAFPAMNDWQPSRSLSALLVLRLKEEGRARTFAFAFGPRGRHLLKEGAYRRRYGLIAALNLITNSDALPRLRAFDTTRHGQNVLRSRVQTTSASTLEVFELDRLRDLIRHATGVPGDVNNWGKRVGGSDALRLGATIEFGLLGAFCRAIDEIASASTYKERGFAWVDQVMPITDQALITVLEHEVSNRLRSGDIELIQLAPPEVVDWDSLTRFQYYFESRGHVERQDLSLAEFLGGLRNRDADLTDASADRLRSKVIRGLNSDHEVIEQWSVWRCVIAELTLDGQTYILEDGSFYEVEADFLTKLNEDIVPFTRQEPLLPSARLGMPENQYNEAVSNDSDDFLSLDAQEITVEGRGKIELCDLLTTKRQLVHVKRYTGSATLSHLFNQGKTSAELLQVNRDFRSAAKALIEANSQKDERFTFIDPDSFRTDEFEIVLAIIKRWNGKGIDTLPFFAKLNLRHSLAEIASRSYRVTVERVSALNAAEWPNA